MEFNPKIQTESYFDLLSTRHNAILEDPWRADWNKLASIEILPDSKVGVDVWTLPEAYASGGRNRMLCSRTIDMRDLCAPTPSLEYDDQVLITQRVKRLAIMMKLIPIRSLNLKRVTVLKVHSWIAYINTLVKSVRWIQLNYPSGDTLFSHLTTEQTLELLGGNKNGRVRAVMARLSAYNRAGYFDDWPVLGDASVFEASRNYVPAPDISASKKSFSTPVSDEALSHILMSSVFLSQQIAPLVISALKKYGSEPICRMTYRGKQTAFKKYLKGVRFRRAWPIEIKLGGVKKQSSSWINRWSQLTSYRALRDLAAKVQVANWIILAFCTAARDSELVELAFDCLRDSNGQNLFSEGFTDHSTTNPNGLLVGKTFKMEAFAAERDWPLPAIAIEAIVSQQKLHRAYISVTGVPFGERLWFPLLSTEMGLKASFGGDLRRFAKAVRVGGRLLADYEEGPIHPHRFRHTMARLIGLSMVNGVHEAFLLLGHKNINMTLRYIRSDPGLQQEIMKIKNEALYALAEEAVTNCNENGGPAADRVTELVERTAARHGGELGVDTIAEAVEILAAGGRAIQLVRDGILCTKTFHDSGPCTKTAGIPDVTNCQVTCIHRLELATARQDAIDAIEAILCRTGAQETSNKMTAAYWSENLKQQMLRFPDVNKQYLSDPRVAEFLLECDRKANA